MKGKRGMAMIICLAGFSGSGKSTLLQRLSQTSDPGWDFKDLDELVQQKLSVMQSASFSSLAVAIEAVGLEKFRHCEKEVLDQLLQAYELGGKSLVLALGGGTLGRGLVLIKRSPQVRLVALDIPFEICWQRIAGDRERPLVQLGAEKMRQKYQRRRALLLESDLILTSADLASELSLSTLSAQLESVGV